MANEKLPPIRPGEVLLEDFLKPLELTPAQLSEKIKMPLNTVHDVIEGNAKITANIALRLARFFNK